MRDLVYLIAELLGREEIQIITDPTKYRPYDVNCLVADNRKAKRLLNWEPKTSIKDGLSKTISWYINNGAKWPWEKRYYPNVILHEQWCK